MGLSISIYATKVASVNIEKKQNDVTSITHLEKQNITKDFYKFRNWLLTNILPEKDIQAIHKTIIGYNIKSIDELQSSLVNLSVKHLKSVGYIPDECSYFRLSGTVLGVLDRIKEINSCNKDNCTEENLKKIVDLLKMRIEYQETFLPKCYELGILLKN